MFPHNHWQHNKGDRHRPWYVSDPQFLPLTPTVPPTPYPYPLILLHSNLIKLDQSHHPSRPNCLSRSNRLRSNRLIIFFSVSVPGLQHGLASQHVLRSRHQDPKTRWQMPITFRHRSLSLSLSLSSLFFRARTAILLYTNLSPCNKITRTLTRVKTQGHLS